MNKQAIIFLTLFSCILMLSIYYITTPIDHTPLSMLASKSIGEVSLLIEETVSSNIAKQSQIIASASSSNEDKKNALLKLDTIKQNQKLASTINDALGKCGFTSAVEVEGDVIKMTVESSVSDVQSASDVIACAYKIGGDTHLYEVTFLLK